MSHGHIAGALITAAAMIISAYIKGRYDGKCKYDKGCPQKDILIIKPKSKK